MIGFLYQQLHGRRLLVTAAIGLTLLGVAGTVFAAFPLKWILDKIVNDRDPGLPLLEPLITACDSLAPGTRPPGTGGHTQFGVLLASGLVLLALGLIEALVTFVRLSVATSVGQDLEAGLRNRVFDHLQHVPLAWHSGQRVGELTQRVSGNISDIGKLVTDGLVDLLSGVLTLLGVLAVMLVISWQFTVLSMCVVPPLFLIVACYTRWTKRASKQVARAAGRVAEAAAATIGAITEVKVFTAQRWASGKFADRVEAQRRPGLRAGRRQAEFGPLVIVLLTLSNTVIVTIGAWIAAGHGHEFGLWFLTIPAGSLTVGTLTVFLAYSKLLYQPMRDLAKLMLLVSTASAAVGRVREILEQPCEQRPGEHGRSSPVRLHGEVAFRGVVFGYRQGDLPVLRGVDLTVRAGSRLALVGLSGGGKSTMVKLLPRLHDPWHGAVTIDGLDTREYPLDVLRGNIAMVLQDSVLFEGTVRDNLLLGRPGASQEQIETAARQACVHDTINRLPGGYDTVVHEGGRNFSSGQRQRMAIARAILRDAPVLILDEPTASLDVEAEVEVMRAVECLAEGRTVIMISHRLSLLGHVDEIAVLQAGRIVEQGSYQQLKARGGVFARMLAEQNRYATEPVELDLGDHASAHREGRVRTT
ncbi:ABC transporter ATP-binding protein [Kutzneria viridogrisea]|uniref:ATP-binding cassette subfamily B protein/subfamily B ATP-binding cassette protein MsbA n=1 Tax=Kutzneria viridogrisea TaxID=47990 RepID=A0ABR6B8Y0_9PSEU|nr:ATP-binding cassette subfamily B protein/subfamily B ATP-binding cassette protein MsbA [Kutzneria viridogrisea]